jgi:hypothetical protein
VTDDRCRGYLTYECGYHEIVPPAAALFVPGIIVQCIKAYHPHHSRTDLTGQERGERFTIRAFCESHHFLMLEEVASGWVNAERFNPVVQLFFRKK